MKKLYLSQELLHYSRTKQHHQVVRILTDKKYLHTILIHIENDQIFIDACLEENMKQIRFLLESKELVEKANINAQNNRCFYISCVKNNLNMLEYFLSFPEFKKNIDINNGIKVACLLGHVETAVFLLENGGDIIKVQRMIDPNTVDQKINNLIEKFYLKSSLETNLATKNIKNHHKI